MLALISKPKFDFEILKSGDLHFSEVAAVLSDVGQYYPNFKEWLYFTFRSGMNSNERKILVAHDGGSMSGLALLKDTAGEKKICTFFILPEYRGQSLGMELMRRSLLELAERNIFITVAEERQKELSPILVASGFTLDSTLANHYRKERTEFFYSR